MNSNEQLINAWLEEERIAHIRGWDFSHIEDRYEEENDLPWDYREVILRHLTPDATLLDLDTGGGEFLLTLGHPHALTSATEGYAPNVRLCRKELTPLGIDFREADASKALPFENERFDMVINRHGDFHAAEIFRVLKPGGLFITQQVGSENDRELVEALLPQETALPFPDQYLDVASKAFRSAGFEILQAQEAFRSIRFFDVGALVWFARIIEWEFPRFSVQGCADRLLALNEQLERGEPIAGRTHRFLLAARKPQI